MIIYIIFCIFPKCTMCCFVLTFIIYTDQVFCVIYASCACQEWDAVNSPLLPCLTKCLREFPTLSAYV